MRKKAANTVRGQQPADRIIKAGSCVPTRLIGRNKGMEILLRERGLYPAAGLKGACQSAQKHIVVGNDCCCCRLLAVQPDFASEVSALQHLVEQRVVLADVEHVIHYCNRHVCLFLPKFHCELNWIERFWGAAKLYVRRHCLYTLPGLRETIPIAIGQELRDLPAHMSHSNDEVPVAPVLLQRRWARISRQYMAEYRKGADACGAIQAVKAQRLKRHRDTSDARSRKIEAQMAAASDHL